MYHLFFMDAFASLNETINKFLTKKNILIQWFSFDVTTKAQLTNWIELILVWKRQNYCLVKLIMFFEMAAMPFPCNGLMLCCANCP